MVRISNTPHEVAAAVSGSIGMAVRKLLQEKHLYQSVDVDVDRELDRIVAVEESKHYADVLKANGVKRLQQLWFALSPNTVAPVSDFTPFHVPDIHAFCGICDKVQPFNLLAAVDCLAFGREINHEFRVAAGRVQTFMFSFLCQGCKRVPEVFTVRRTSTKVTLCGRAPMEQVQLPKVIPHAARSYVSGAMVAHQSGQTLAGLFLLRVAIEQWIRSLGAKHEKADQALDWYMSTLPADFKSWAPSLRDIYAQLSEAIHRADASPDLFDKANADIERHFDARRVRGIPEPKA